MKQSTSHTLKVFTGNAHPALAKEICASLGVPLGKAFVGTWRKKDAGDLTRFYDASGNEITLVRGRIFIQVVPTGTNVTYSLK